jgi:hypothetical protein
MPLTVKTVKMVASEVLMCGLKRVPFAGPAVEVLESIRLKHELISQARSPGRDRRQAILVRAGAARPGREGDVDHP